MCGHTWAALSDLADRIDAEMMELPKDADGVPIRTGDTMYAEDGREANVFGIYIMQHKENVVCILSNGGNIVRAPRELSHERPDSLERIANELDGWRALAANDCRIKAMDEDIIHNLIERIRKLAEKENK